MRLTRRLPCGRAEIRAGVQQGHSAFRGLENCRCSPIHGTLPEWNPQVTIT